MLWVSHGFSGGSVQSPPDPPLPAGHGRPPRLCGLRGEERAFWVVEGVWKPKKPLGLDMAMAQNYGTNDPQK